jgi:hypothetical protein
LLEWGLFALPSIPRERLLEFKASICNGGRQPIFFRVARTRHGKILQREQAVVLPGNSASLSPERFTRRVKPRIGNVPRLTHYGA